MNKLTELKTFEDACEVEGIDPGTVAILSNLMQDSEALTALAKLFVIVRAANRLVNDGNEWKPDWNDGQWKYHAWFGMDGGSSGFRYLGYGCWVSGSTVGSRLCFKTSEAARYVGTQFIDLYKQFMVIE